MKILVITLVVLVVIDTILTYIAFRRFNKKLFQQGPVYQINNLRVEEIYWSQILLKDQVSFLRERDAYVKCLVDEGAKKIAIKLLKSGLVEVRADKYVDGTEKISLTLKVVRPDGPKNS